MRLTKNLTYVRLRCLIWVFSSCSAEGLWKGASGVQVDSFYSAYSKSLFHATHPLVMGECLIIKMFYIIFFGFFWCLSCDQSLCQQCTAKYVFLYHAQLRSLTLI